jgi:hypothetical protein
MGVTNATFKNNYTRRCTMKATKFLLAIVTVLVIMSSILSLTVLFTPDARADNLCLSSYKPWCPWHEGWYYNASLDCCCNPVTGFTEC